MRWRDLVVGFLVVMAGWQLLSWAIARPIVPGIVPILETFWEEMRNGDLRVHFLVSTRRVVLAILAALVTGVPAGLALGQFRTLDRLFAPLIYIAYPVPKIVFLPIFILLLGLGDLSKIAIIAFILFFQILVVVRDEAVGIRPELVASVRSLGAGRLALLRYVYLPATVPAVLTALRVSIGTAVAVLFFAESFATRAGLGYYIITDAFSRVAYREMYAGVLAMSLLGLALYYLSDWLERRLAPWMFVE